MDHRVFSRAKEKAFATLTAKEVEEIEASFALFW